MAVKFDGTNQIDISSWTNYTTVTVSFWTKLVDSLAARFLGSDNFWEIRTDGTENPVLVNELFQGTTRLYGVTNLELNIWYHIVTTAIKSSGVAEIFLDGNSESSGSDNIGSPTGSTLALGNRFGASDGQLQGILDDVRVYDRILSLEEIKTIYACRGIDNILYGLKNRWLLNEKANGVVVSGTDSVKDITGSDHGTPVDSPVYEGSFLKFKRTFSKV